MVMEIFFIYHVASRDHVFKGLCNFVGGSFLLKVTTLLTLMAIGLVLVDI